MTRWRRAGALPSLARAESSTLLVLVNFHRFLQSAEIVQAMVQQIALGKQHRTFVVVLSPVVQIPVELEKPLVLVEHPLPDRPQLLEIARGLVTQAGDLPEGMEQDQVFSAASGLTRKRPKGPLASP